MSRNRADIPVDRDDVRTLLGTATLKAFTSPGRDLFDALELLEWNLYANGALLETVAMVELIVRMAIDRTLSDWAKQRSAVHWLQLIELDGQMHQVVSRARTKAMGKKKNPRKLDEVPLHLPFGFWRYLVTPRRHTSLWVPALHRAFPYGAEELTTRRECVSKDLETLVSLRNRVAHHDPIFRRNLFHDYEAALRVTRAVHPSAGDWIKRQSRLPELANGNPWLGKL